MHAIFIPYGKRSEVELFFREMEAQKHKWLMWKGKEKLTIYIQGAVRTLPFGIIEYVFPREDRDAVLTSLKFQGYEQSQYKMEDIKLAFLKGNPVDFMRKILKCSPIPEFKIDKNYLWVNENVMIIPIGIREDEDMTEKEGKYKGWTHEAL